MPIWLQWSLLVLFAVHGVAFGVVWTRRRTPRHAVLTLTFALLVGSFAMRIAVPGLAVAGVGAYWIPRVLAWCCGASALVMLLRARARKSAGPGD